MDHKTLAKVVKAVASHASTDRTRRVLGVTEVARSVAPEQIRLIATDGRRAIVAYVDATPEVLAALPDTGAPRYWARDADKRLAVGVVPECNEEPAPGAQYPDVRALIAIPGDDEPRTAPHVGVGPSYLASACDACAAIAKACGDGRPGVKITLPPDGMAPIHIRWSWPGDHSSVHAVVMPMRL